MAEPFTPARVTRFLLLCALAMGAVFAFFFLLTHVTGHKSVEPTASHSTLAPALLPGRGNGIDRSACL